MKMKMLRLEILLVLCVAVLTTADDEYEKKLTKLWSLSGASNSDGSVNVTSTSIVIQPSSYEPRQSVQSKYAFKPRAIPLIREEPTQVERNVYYSQKVDKIKPKTLFPGNLYPIAKAKSNINLTEDTYSSDGVPFHPRAIPLIRNPEFQRRSLDVNEEPLIEKPEGFSEVTASRRSLSCKFV